MAPTKKSTATSATKKSTATSAKGKNAGFTADERAAMKARTAELKAEERANKNRAAGESDLLAAIAAMKAPDRALAQRIHAIVQDAAPHLWPKTWYGMPAYTRDGKVVLYYKAAEKFGTRYGQLGFEEAAKLDDGAMWPTVYALTKLSPAEEKKISALVKKAAG
jgi:uncharacterized protein YdhG (YjbR/CyaY superfamily)